MNSITNETHISAERDNTLKSAADNQGRNVYTPKGKHPVKYNIVSTDVLVISNILNCNTGINNDFFVFKFT